MPFDPDYVDLAPQLLVFKLLFYVCKIALNSSVLD